MSLNEFFVKYWKRFLKNLLINLPIIFITLLSCTQIVVAFLFLVGSIPKLIFLDMKSAYLCLKIAPIGGLVSFWGDAGALWKKENE